MDGLSSGAGQSPPFTIPHDGGGNGMPLHMPLAADSALAAFGKPVPTKCWFVANVSAASPQLRVTRTAMTSNARALELLCAATVARFPELPMLLPLLQLLQTPSLIADMRGYLFNKARTAKLSTGLTRKSTKRPRGTTGTTQRSNHNEQRITHT